MGPFRHGPRARGAGRLRNRALTLYSIAPFSLDASLHSLLAIVLAFVLGTAIGFERQWRQRTAGLRTNVLVAVGAAAFADLGLRLRGVEGGTQIIAYIVSGIGFLGAGVIVKQDANIRGLNTAATLWCSGAVGSCAGAGLLFEAAELTLAVLAANTLLRPLVNWVNRRPIPSGSTEAQYAVHVVTRPEDVTSVRDLLDEVVSAAGYPLRSIETESVSDDQVELAAELVPTTAGEAELDAIVTTLEQSPLVRSATWVVEVSG